MFPVGAVTNNMRICVEFLLVVKQLFGRDDNQIGAPEKVFLDSFAARPKRP